MHIHEVLRAAAAAPAGTAALVVVTKVRGSAPRHAGSMMLVHRDGYTVGTTGGGKGEHDAQMRALEALARARAACACVSMTGDSATEQDPICGGVADIAIVPLGQAEAAVCTALAAALDAGSTVGLKLHLAAIQAGAPLSDLALISSASAEEQKTAHYAIERENAAGLPVALPDGSLLCPVSPRERLLILGGGHVGLALAEAAHKLDFTVTVGDFRPEYANKARFPPEVNTILGEFEPIVANFACDASTYIVVVSPGHVGDLECVRAILKERYRYAGCIGSKRKIAMMLDELKKEGFDPAQVDALHGPIGLNIGAETPAEIAVSILAEIVAVRRNASQLRAHYAEREIRRALGRTLDRP